MSVWFVACVWCVVGVRCFVGVCMCVFFWYLCVMLCESVFGEYVVCGM